MNTITLEFNLKLNLFYCGDVSSPSPSSTLAFSYKKEAMAFQKAHNLKNISITPVGNSFWKGYALMTSLGSFLTKGSI